MQAAAVLYRTTIGKKAIMAVTGLIWIGFVILHMYGNLKAFQGREVFDHYAEGLRTLGDPVFGYLHLLTLARIVLVVAIVLHVWAAYTLWQQARQARPANYATRRIVQANYASLTMRWGGATILLFVLFHLAQLTWGTPVISPEFVRGAAYDNLLASFRSWPVTIFYLLAVAALGFHIYHGTWSMLQTLGFMSRAYDGIVRALSLVLAILIPLGFAVVPISVQLGIIN